MAMFSALVVSALMLGACSQDVAPDPNPQEVDAAMPEPVFGLPHAQGRGFATLDDYLAHLREMGAQDRPYYEEIGPGRYHRIAGRRPPGPAGEPRVYTRAELLEMYGFAE